MVPSATTMSIFQIEIPVEPRRDNLSLLSAQLTLTGDPYSTFRAELAVMRWRKRSRLLSRPHPLHLWSRREGRTRWGRPGRTSADRPVRHLRKAFRRRAESTSVLAHRLRPPLPFSHRQGERRGTLDCAACRAHLSRTNSREHRNGHGPGHRPGKRSLNTTCSEYTGCLPRSTIGAPGDCQATSGLGH